MVAYILEKAQTVKAARGKKRNLAFFFQNYKLCTPFVLARESEEL
jgi:hypothetical protein